MNRLCLALIAAFIAASAFALDCRYANPAPDHSGYRSLGGRMLADQGDGREYAIEVLCRKQDRLILFQRIESRTDKGLPVTTTLDSRKLSVTKPDDVLIDSLCDWKGVEGEEIVGVGHMGKGKDIVRKAWRANSKTGKLEVLPVSEVHCVSPDGDD